MRINLESSIFINATAKCERVTNQFKRDTDNRHVCHCEWIVGEVFVVMDLISPRRIKFEHNLFRRSKRMERFATK